MNTSKRLLATLVAACLAAADISPVFHSTPRHGSVLGLSARQSSECPNDYQVCDIFCIESSYKCCGLGQGEACDAGYYCTSDGCCRDGTKCSGPPTGCTENAVLCDNICIPADGVCCNRGDKSWCDKGEICMSSGKCGRTSSGGGGGGSSPDRDPGVTTIFMGSPTATTIPQRGGKPLPRTSSAPNEIEVGGNDGGGGGYSLAPVQSDEAGANGPSTPSNSQAAPTGASSDKDSSDSGSGSAGDTKDGGKGTGVALKVPLAVLAAMLAVVV